MSRIKLKFVDPLGTVTPTNSAVLTGDSLPAAVDKLQGQINSTNATANAVVAGSIKEVYVGAVSAPNFNAVNFMPMVIQGQTVYKMQVSA